MNSVKADKNIGDAVVHLKTERGFESEEDDEPMRVPCCMCGQLTTRDPIYQDLCYRCIRADNE